ncbi:MAG: hypothetical protein ACJ79H_18005 [Myxococcales bacterium]
MARNFLLGFAVLICACAGRSKVAAVAEPVAQRGPAGERASARDDSAPPLLVGHGTDGELVMASTHHDAMNGLAVASTEIGASPRSDGNNDLVCKREVITGTHLPEWVCRYRADVEENQKRTQLMMLKLTTSCPRYECVGE